MSVKAHKRADTYEGPQMNFKFPSDEDLIIHHISKEDKVELTGPKIEPYFKYEQEYQKNDNSPGNKQWRGTEIYCIDENVGSSESAFSESGKTDRSLSNTYSHQHQKSNRSSGYNSNQSMHHGQTTVSIPSQDNITYQITRSSMRSDSSLYRKASLKRAKAVRYKIGWLTRLKQFGINIRNKLKKWRIISVKKAFKTTGRKVKLNKRSMKKNISMPLERGRAKSISELKREINDWYVPQEPKLTLDGTLQEPPTPQHRIISEGSRTSFKRTPPPLPPHRIASSPMLRIPKQPDQKNSKSTHPMNRSFSTPAGSNILQEQPKVQPLMLQPQTTPYHPYQALASTEDITNPHIASKIAVSDQDLNCQFDEHYYDTKENDDLIRDLWRGYLRRTIAARIESKLEIHRIAQISEPVQQQEYAEEVFGIISDYDSEQSISDFDDADNESLTSMSGSEFSTSTDSNSQIMSETSTNYFSTYSSGPDTSLPPIELSRESYNFIQAQLQNVRRSSTLPNATDRLTAQKNLESSHNRFLSVIN